MRPDNTRPRPGRPPVARWGTRWGRAAALAVAFGALVWGNAAAAQQTQSVCQRLWATATGLIPVDIGQATVEAQGSACRISDIAGTYDGSRRVTIDEIVIDGQGLAALADSLTPPTAIDLAVTGLRLSGVTGDAVFDYLLAAQAQSFGMNLALSTRWDGLTRRLVIDPARIDFANGDFVAATARLEGVDLSSPEAMAASAGTLAASALTLDVQTDGLFEATMLFALGDLLLGGSSDPAREVARLKALAQARIEALPEPAFAAQSRTALGNLVADMPNPRGLISLTLRANPPFEAIRLVPLTLLAEPDLDNVLGLLEGVSVVVAYTRQPGP